MSSAPGEHAKLKKLLASIKYAFFSRCALFSLRSEEHGALTNVCGVYRKKGDQHGGGGEQEAGGERREDVPNLREPRVPVQAEGTGMDVTCGHMNST